MRTLSAGVQAAVSCQTGSFFHLLELEFNSGSVYLTSAGGAVTWNGNVYSAIGGHFSIGSTREGHDAGSRGLDLTLEAVDRTVLADIVDLNWVGHPITLRRAYIDSTYNDILTDPITIFRGLNLGDWEYEEQYNELGPTTATLKTTVGSLLSIGTFVRGMRANLDDHQKYHGNNDTFYKYVKQLSEGIGIVWDGKSLAITPTTLASST